MKRNSTLVCTVYIAVLIFSLIFSVAHSQSIAPKMTYANSTLVSGISGEIGATYKFPSVTPGVDGFITIKDKVGGASLTNIDDNIFGYSAAWQPVVKTPLTQGAGESYISFQIDFKDSINGNSYKYDNFEVSFIDIDGDNQNVREFVAVKDFDSYTISNITSLILNDEDGLLKATGPIQNYINIDTSAYATNINFRFIQKDKVSEVRIGNIVNNTFLVQDRYSSGYFQNIAIPFVSILPVKYSSFDAVVIDNKSVNLNWVTSFEQNNSRFEVERSFDMNYFKAIGIVLDGFFTQGSDKKYMYKDNTPELKDKLVVYYRLRQINMDGKSTYSNVLAVRLQNKSGVEMQVSPNPFVENLNIRFNSVINGFAEMRIMNISGQKIYSKHITIYKGYYNIQVNDLSKNPPGLYLAQLIIDGTIIDTQKIIRN